MSATKPTEAPVNADSPTTLDNSGPANIAPATTFSTSGAAVQIVPDVDPSHPAVDANPRANTTVMQNKIDFNDPTKSGPDVVAEQLGMKTQDEADAETAAKAKTKEAAKS